MCVCSRRFLSINTPSDLTEETCSIGTLSIESSSGFDKELNFCLQPVSINLVLAVLEINLEGRCLLPEFLRLIALETFGDAGRCPAILYLQ